MSEFKRVMVTSNNFQLSMAEVESLIYEEILLKYLPLMKGTVTPDRRDVKFKYDQFDRTITACWGTQHDD